MLDLSKPYGSNACCGPTAISILTGASTDDAERALCDVSGRVPPIVGVDTIDLVQAIRRFGLELIEWLNFEEHEHPPRLVDLNDDFLAPSTYVVGLRKPGHVLVLQMAEDWRRIVAVDNRQRVPVPIRHFRLADSPVDMVWRLRRAD